MSEHDHTHGHIHQLHQAVVKRLKRDDGHLRSVITMIEEGPECVAIAQQLHAFEKAICQAKRTLIQTHMSWVPVMGDPITMIAGVMREPFWSFLAVVTVAKTLRYLVLTSLTLIGTA